MSQENSTPESEVRHPEVEVQLSGNDGNGFMIVGRTSSALHRGGVPEEEIKVFRDDATSGDYNHLLQTVMKWVTVL